MESQVQTTRKLIDDKWVKIVSRNAPVTAVNISPACNPGECFTSIVNRASLRCSTADGGYEFKSVILKRLPDEDAPENKIMNCKRMFENEVVAYTKILPILEMVYESDQLPIAKLISSTDSLIILQDLQPLNYKMLNSKNGLNLLECQQCIKGIARLHARSLILKSEDLGKFHELAKMMQETIFHNEYEETVLEAIWENSLWEGCTILSRSGNSTLTKAGKALEKFSRHFFITMRNLIKSDDAFTVVSHGDLWNNNVLFKFDGNEAVASVCFVDFQGIRSTSCAIDLLHFLCTSSEVGLIGSHMNTLLQLYYEEVTKYMNKSGKTMPFTFANLCNEICEKVMYGIALGFMLIRVSTNENAPDMPFDIEVLKSSEWREKNFASINELCCSRIRQLILDLMQLNYFRI